jgi:hypothetical protein
MTSSRPQRDPRHHSGTHVVSTPAMRIALLAQSVVLAGTFLKGLGWGLWVIVRLSRRQSGWAPFVPLVSAAVTAGLLLAAVSYTKAIECSEEGLAAMSEIDHPDGLVMDFTGSMHNGCRAHDYTSMPAHDVIAQYNGELTRNGWDTLEPPAGEAVAAERDGVRVYVQTVPVDDGLVPITIS